MRWGDVVGEVPININTEEDINSLHGLPESRALEFKRQPIKTDKLVQHIQGAMNGTESKLTIIFGVNEDDQGRLDSGKKSPIHYPFTIEDMKQKFKGFDDYRLHVFNSLYGNTENFREGLIKIREISLKGGGGVIVIDVWRSEDRPHQNTKDHRHYIRGDGRTSAMTSAELRAAFGNTENETELFPQPLPFGPGDIIADIKDDFSVDGNEIALIEGDITMTLRLIPRNNSERWSATDLRKLKQSWGGILPTLGRWSSASYSRNEYGFVMYGLLPDQSGKTDTLTQIFKDGEIASVLSFVPRGGPKGGFIPSSFVVTQYANTLHGMVNCMKNSLKIDTPYTVLCSLDRAKGKPIALANHNFSEGSVEERIEMIIEIDDSDIMRILDNATEYSRECRITLGPFYEAIWDACGLEWSPELSGYI